MTDIATPAWCRWRHGHSAVLVIAPHGGRREPLPPPGRPAPGARPGPRERKVNDLHTADLAEELADALDASLIVNPAIDRNQLDLNRISQVAARAPWFLALIETLLENILARHACAEVLFVHGWNVVQPKCDIGVGHTLVDALAAHTHAEALTISPGYAEHRLGRLRALCATEGIATAFGERYAARHPNNLLQLFRPTATGTAAAPRLAAWVATRRVEAVQLELGVPVRWPGTYRHGFLRAAAAAFNGGTLPAAVACTQDASPTLLVPPASLQLYDPHTEVGLTARVDAAGPDGMSGRVLLFLGSERLALFLGEDTRTGWSRGYGPHFTPAQNGFRMRFTGVALATDDGRLYVDLEQAFAASRLCAITVDLRFQHGLSADYGSACGWVEVDGERRHVTAPAFSRHGVLQRSGGPWSTQVVLSAAFGSEHAVRVRHEFPGAGVLHELTARGAFAHPLPPLTVRLEGDRYTPSRIVVGDGAPLLCQPLTRMTISRPLPAHRDARVTFGAARFTRHGEEGFGFYEYGRALV